MIAVFQVASVFSAMCAIIYLLSYQLVKYFKVKRATKAVAEQTKVNGTILSNGNYMPLPTSDQKY